MTDVILLDGGMGQELIRRSGGKATPLWSTQVMIDHPGLVGEVHADYAAAGATVATTNSYAIHRDRLRGGSTNHYASGDVDLPDREAEFAMLLGNAMAEADTVRDRGKVAASIGPLGASYRADLHPGHDEAVGRYREVLEIVAPKADIFLFETIASVAAGRACLEAAQGFGKPVWLAFTVDDEDGALLRSQEPVVEAAEACSGADVLLANCSTPEAMPPALEALKTVGKPFGAYANAFTTITKDFLTGGTTANDLSARKDLGPDAYAEHALKWVEQGATIVGGCCETGPAHIEAIARRLRENGHTIV